MAPYDLLVKGGALVDTTNVVHADLCIADGKIQAVVRDAAPELAAAVVDASGCYVLPGIFDAHVHPIYADSMETLSLSAAHGGITTLIHFIGSGNFTAWGARPEWSLADSIEHFRGEGERTSYLDFAFHAAIAQADDHLAVRRARVGNAAADHVPLRCARRPYSDHPSCRPARRASGEDLQALPAEGDVAGGRRCRCRARRSQGLDRDHREHATLAGGLHGLRRHAAARACRPHDSAWANRLRARNAAGVSGLGPIPGARGREPYVTGRVSCPWRHAASSRGPRRERPAARRSGR